MVGHPYETVTNNNGCPECRCLCPEIDCNAECGGEGLGNPGPTDLAGCVVRCMECTKKRKVFLRPLVKEVFSFISQNKCRCLTLIEFNILRREPRKC